MVDPQVCRLLVALLLPCLGVGFLAGCGQSAAQETAIMPPADLAVPAALVDKPASEESVRHFYTVLERINIRHATLNVPQ